MTRVEKLKEENGRLIEEIGKLLSENTSLKEEVLSLQSANKYIKDELDSFKKYNYALKTQITDMEQMLKLEQEKRSIVKQKYKNFKLKIANLLIK